MWEGKFWRIGGGSDVKGGWIRPLRRRMGGGSRQQLRCREAICKQSKPLHGKALVKVSDSKRERGDAAAHL
eukprot:992865-Rhodomonas_salina.3